MDIFKPESRILRPENDLDELLANNKPLSVKAYFNVRLLSLRRLKRYEKCVPEGYTIDCSDNGYSFSLNNSRYLHCLQLLKIITKYV